MDKQTEEIKNKFRTVKWSQHVCGSGSVFENTEGTRKLLASLTAKYNIRSISDAGAGDLSWIHATEWPHEVEYRAYDIFPRHEDVNEFDITSQVLPKADLILCRHVLNHLFRWPDRCQQAMKNFVDSGSTYLLATHVTEQATEYNKMWGEPLQTTSEFIGNRLWCFSFWKIND